MRNLRKKLREFFDLVERVEEHRHRAAVAIFSQDVAARIDRLELELKLGRYDFLQAVLIDKSSGVTFYVEEGPTGPALWHTEQGNGYLLGDLSDEDIRWLELFIQRTVEDTVITLR